MQAAQAPGSAAHVLNPPSRATSAKVRHNTQLGSTVRVSGLGYACPLALAGCGCDATPSRRTLDCLVESICLVLVWSLCVGDADSAQCQLTLFNSFNSINTE